MRTSGDEKEKTSDRKQLSWFLRNNTEVTDVK